MVRVITTFLYSIYSGAPVMEILRVYTLAESQVSKYIALNLGSKVLNLFSNTNINLAHFYALV
jgi:hypothetical protein